MDPNIKIREDLTIRQLIRILFPRLIDNVLKKDYHCVTDTHYSMDKVSGDTFKLITPLNYSVSSNLGHLDNVQHRIKNMTDLSACGALETENL